MGPTLDGPRRPVGDGVTGFSIGADPSRDRPGQFAGPRAWESAATERPSRLVSGSFYLLGGPDADAELKRFAHRLPGRLRRRAADALLGIVELSSPARLLDALAAAEAVGCDEFILVPGTVDPDVPRAPTAEALAG